MQKPSAKHQASTAFPEGPKQKVAKEAQRQVEGVTTLLSILALPRLCLLYNAPLLIQTHAFTKPMFDPLSYQRQNSLQPPVDEVRAPLYFIRRIDTHNKIHLYKETHHYQLNSHRSWTTAFSGSF